MRGVTFAPGVDDGPVPDEHETTTAVIRAVAKQTRAEGMAQRRADAVERATGIWTYRNRERG